MQKLTTFFFGLIVGAVMMLIGLKFSIVHTDSGRHLIRKSNNKLTSAYIDVREFSAADWKSHIDLATDIANSKNKELQEELTQSAVDNSLQSIWDSVRN